MRIPVIPTIVVLAACGIMVWLGVWQLGRADEKAELIARYEAALSDDLTIHFSSFADSENVFHKAALLCEEVSEIRQVAGRNARGQSGWVAVARCTTGGPASHLPLRMPSYNIEPVDVILGWDNRIDEVEWDGGLVEGRIIAPGEEWGRVIADPPLAGLQANAKPDPNDLPNNHLSYAVQWFLFALTALVIYILALRRRGRDN